MKSIGSSSGSFSSFRSSPQLWRRVPSQGLIAVILAPKDVVRFICACSLIGSADLVNIQKLKSSREPGHNGKTWKNMEKHGKTWKNLHIPHTTHIPTVPTWNYMNKTNKRWLNGQSFEVPHGSFQEGPPNIELPRYRELGSKTRGIQNWFRKSYVMDLIWFNDV